MLLSVSVGCSGGGRSITQSPSPGSSARLSIKFRYPVYDTRSGDSAALKLASERVVAQVRLHAASGDGHIASSNACGRYPAYEGSRSRGQTRAASDSRMSPGRIVIAEATQSTPNPISSPPLTPNEARLRHSRSSLQKHWSLIA